MGDIYAHIHTALIFLKSNIYAQILSEHISSMNCMCCRALSISSLQQPLPDALTQRPYLGPAQLGALTSLLFITAWEGSTGSPTKQLRI